MYAVSGVRIDQAMYYFMDYPKRIDLTMTEDIRLALKPYLLPDGTYDVGQILTDYGYHHPLGWENKDLYWILNPAMPELIEDWPMLTQIAYRHMWPLDAMATQNWPFTDDAK